MTETTSARRFPPYERHVFICMHEREAGSARGCCLARGADGVLKRFKTLVEQHRLSPRIRAQKAGCLDTCEFGISVVVYPDVVWYKGVTEADVDEIVQSHLINGVPVERLRMHPKQHSGA